jgi:hypothetical protein
LLFPRPPRLLFFIVLFCFLSEMEVLRIENTLTPHKTKITRKTKHHNHIKEPVISLQTQCAAIVQRKKKEQVFCKTFKVVTSPNFAPIDTRAPTHCVPRSRPIPHPTLATMEFAEVVDHPDQPGQYMTPEEHQTYMAEQEAEALKTKQEQKKKQERMVQDKLNVDAGLLERQARLQKALDPSLAHPASGASDSYVLTDGGITESNPWREDVEDRGLGSQEVHPAAYRVVTKNGQRATKLKELGNARYKDQDFFEGIRYYGQALAYCPVDATHAHARAVCHSNRGACYMALGKYRRVVEETSMAIELDPRYVRALLRRAKAYELMDRL